MLRLFLGLFTILYLSHTSTAQTSVCQPDKPCEVPFKAIGCFKDYASSRKLPEYIYNERDPTASNYGGRSINWYQWTKHLAGFPCRCAAKAQQEGYDLFGVQFYGECWAAKSENVDMASLTTSGASCLGEGYDPCGTHERYCAGEKLSNFIYKIVNTSCSINFVKEGCFKDNHHQNARPLGYYVMNDRDSTAPSYSGQSIDWRNWDVYVPEFACRCAHKAKQNGSTYFGLQYYGECWTHPDGADTYGRDGPASNCVDNCYKPCRKGEFCFGVQFSNYVYRIEEEEESCDANIEPIGCYVENPNNRVLSVELVNAVTPSPSHTFYGSMAIPGDWDGFFTDFLCRCAREAKIKNQHYFGVSNNGVCYTDNVSTNYANLGSSTSCYEGSEDDACGNGSKKCCGINPTASYVYKI